MATGVVARFSGEKGWGFVKPDGGGPDVMVHVKDLMFGEDAASLRQGVLVSYSERSGPRGMRATGVRVLVQETEPSGDDVPGYSDVLTASQFRDEVTGIMAGAVSRLEEAARRHGWIG